MSASSVTKAPTKTARTKLFGKKTEPRDYVTLRLFVRRALKDAMQTLEADPYLRRSLEEIENETDVEERGALERAYSEIDNYISQSVEFYLRNRPKNDRVRAKSVSCVAATDLNIRRARCIVTVKAWGHMRREIIDLELPQP
ncbi:MAG: hypothetical protein AAFP81_00910 [Pseudomonadota bacterium]